MLLLKNRAKFRPYKPDEMTHHFPSPDTDRGGVTERTYNLFLAIKSVCSWDLKCTSGYRTEAHNAAVGGVKDSAHLRGLALDLETSSDRQRFVIVRYAIELGVTRIGIYHDHVHIDIDTSLPSCVMWMENSR